MALSFETFDTLFDHGFDTVIDVRSPAEFAEDHVPGAINLPVLDNDERARVGTMYKQISPFQARKIGAALVFRNAASHIENHLSHHDGRWRPLVYCWRGGQRSGSFAWMLREIGWRSDTIEGGYRSFRRLVSKALYETPLPVRLVQLGGYTGTAKTELLHRIAARGVQVLDLEDLARHRGSLLGARPEGQPSQKAFETALASQLNRFDAARPVIVEAESSKIGQINLPPSLWDAMKQAHWIEISAPLAARAHYLRDTYEDVLTDTDGLRDKLEPLRFHRGHALVDHWNALIDAQDQLALCASLADQHYDPAYRRSMRAVAPRFLAKLEADSLAPQNLDKLADQIAETLHSNDSVASASVI
ncbi:tRNA 2-selenouridine(34) synthase MnmH [Pacificoceanicola onchidii]|uniref:tRNA 2-selenouridine(34) synthase MnmH n=1 Tax=Pacificoceanicola onchidii TaxID=2562685 RepID=UPI0010A50420|nr:tRNA 2-selenouridine(34) synthase MnmH [Pacificoceanicola onchidii]